MVSYSPQAMYMYIPPRYSWSISPLVYRGGSVGGRWSVVGLGTRMETQDRQPEAGKRKWAS